MSVSGLYLSLFIITFVPNLLSYFMIRTIIWSIVRLDSARKSKKYYSLKKSIRKDKSISIIHKITMKCLKPYVNYHESDYIIWLRIKIGFIVLSMLVEVISMIVIYFSDFDVIVLLYIKVGLAALIMFLIRFIMFDSERKSKYDIIRMNTKNGRQNKK